MWMDDVNQQYMTRMFKYVPAPVSSIKCNCVVLR